MCDSLSSLIRRRIAMGKCYSRDVRESVMAAADSKIGADAGAPICRVGASYIAKALGRRQTRGATSARLGWTRHPPDLNDRRRLGCPVGGSGRPLGWAVPPHREIQPRPSGAGPSCDRTPHSCLSATITIIIGLTSASTDALYLKDPVQQPIETRQLGILDKTPR
jgi:hypothetical protein